MNTENELLNHIYQSCYMGVVTLTTLLKELKDKDNKIKKQVEDILKQYEIYLKDSNKLMKKNKVKPNKMSMIEKSVAKNAVKKEVKNDNSDSNISDMVIRGLMMGIVDITKKIEVYKSVVDKDIIRVAKDVVNFQEESINQLRDFL